MLVVFESVAQLEVSIAHEDCKLSQSRFFVCLCNSHMGKSNCRRPSSSDTFTVDVPFV